MRLSLRKPEFELYPEANQELKPKVKYKAEKKDVVPTKVMFFLKDDAELFRKSLR